MKTRNFVNRLEKCVLILLLLSFIALFTNNVEFMPIANTDYFINCDVTGGPYDGLAPYPSGGHGPWKYFSQVTGLTTGDYVYVCPGTHDLPSNYTIAASGGSGSNVITFSGDPACTVFTSHSPGDVILDGYNNTPAIQITGDYVILENFFIYGNNQTAIEVTGDYVSIKNNVIYGNNAKGIESSYCDYTLIENCQIYADDLSIWANVCNDLEINNCDLYKTDNTGTICELNNCDDFEVFDCTTQMSGANYCTINVNIIECNEGTFYRNQISATGEKGICVVQSSYLDFNNNGIYGSFSVCAIDDSNNCSVGGKWNFNTVNNMGNGDGYVGQRANGNNLESFRNNILQVASTLGNPPLPIDIPISPTDWQPPSGYLDYNCYKGYLYTIGEWGPNNIISGIGNWQTATGDSYNCVNENPNLVTGGFYLMSNSPASCINGGVYITGIDYDFEKGVRPTYDVSRGADQYAFAVFTPDPVAFGAVSVTSFKDLDLTVTFYGQPDLTISYVTFSNADFSSASGSYYFTNGSGIITIRFTPTRTNPPYNETVEISHNCPASGTIVQVGLTGSGTTP